MLLPGPGLPGSPPGHHPLDREVSADGETEREEEHEDDGHLPPPVRSVHEDGRGGAGCSWVTQWMPPRPQTRS